MMHDYGPVILLFLGIFGGIWMNRRDYTALKEDIRDLKGDINNFKADMNSRLTRIEDDQKQFFKSMGELEGRVEELSRR